MKFEWNLHLQFVAFQVLKILYKFDQHVKQKGMQKHDSMNGNKSKMK